MNDSARSGRRQERASAKISRAGRGRRMTHQRPTLVQVSNVAMPILIPAAIQQVFRATDWRWCLRHGHQGGLAIYWATCWATAADLVGPRRLARLWRRPAAPSVGL